MLASSPFLYVRTEILVRKFEPQSTNNVIIRLTLQADLNRKLKLSALTNIFIYTTYLKTLDHVDHVDPMYLTRYIFLFTYNALAIIRQKNSLR